uniref:Retrovirus-related Pol polyprotein from transposon TNT 1-94-like beta-barrel domain-containing protein n=1 Tax=Brassica oleracea var. oleracea TaxID=109376 RepID=A0A0D3AR70_BRAOL
MQIEDYLYGKKLHQPLSKKPEKMDQDVWELLDRQVLGVIRLTLSKNVAHNVAKEKTAEGLMKVLSDMYEKPLANNKMEEGGLVAAHVNEFNTIVNQLSSVEIEFDDEVRALILLASLPNSWEPMRAVVSNSVGTQKLRFNDVRDRILAEEVRRIDSGEASTSSAFNVENRGRNPDRNNRSNGRSKSRNGRGHIKKNCRAPPKKEDNTRGGTNAVTREIAGALVVSVDSPRKIEARDAATNTTKASISYVDSPVDSWVLDSGASFHTTLHHNIMENYVAGNYGKVYLADGLPLDIVGIGDINLKMSDGRVWRITKVRHVPKLMRNLISVDQAASIKSSTDQILKMKIYTHNSSKR